MATEPTPTDAELTECYKAANGEDVGKAQPLITQRIFRAMRAAIARWGAQPAPAASQKPLTDGQRLAFLCSTEKPRRIEHQNGLWRVYQDEAPAESEHADWRALTYLFYATPEQAIDEAACCNTKGA